MDRRRFLATAAGLALERFAHGQAKPQFGRIDPAELQRFGWAGPAAARAARKELAQFLPEYLPPAREIAARQVYLWNFVDLLGQDFKTSAQQIGDCVSHGFAHAVFFSLATHLAVKGGKSTLRPIYPPYIYGVSRVQVGGGRIGGDGSVGAWAAKGCQDYGVIASDMEGVPPYSGAIARQWGQRPGPPARFLTVGKKFLCEARLVKNFEEACQALSSGYAIAVCSGQGFQMRAVERHGRLEGVPSGNWPHCMAWLGYDSRPDTSAVYNLNSWGEEAHGAPDDYRRLNTGPAGGFWIRKDTANRMLAENDSYAVSFNGFQDHLFEDWLREQNNFRGIPL